MLLSVKIFCCSLIGNRYFSEFIDESNTIWGSQVACDYLTFIPLIAAIVATVWLVMFLMCGNGGQSKHS